MRLLAKAPNGASHPRPRGKYRSTALAQEAVGGYRLLLMPRPLPTSDPTRFAYPAVRALAIVVVLLHFAAVSLQPTDGTTYADLPSRSYAFDVPNSDKTDVGAAAIRIGDLLVAVRGRALTTTADLEQMMTRSGPEGDKEIGVTLYRAESQRRVELNVPRQQLASIFRDVAPGLLILDVADPQLDLKRGDVIIKMNGDGFPLPIGEDSFSAWRTTVRDWLLPAGASFPFAIQGDRMLTRLGPGASVEYEVVRDGDLRVVQVPIRRRGIDPWIAFATAITLAILLVGLSMLTKPQVGFGGWLRIAAGWLITGLGVLDLFYETSPTLPPLVLAILDGSILILLLAIMTVATPPRWPEPVEE